MEKIQLTAKVRKKKSKNRDFSDFIPAVLYGHDVKNENLWVKRVAFARAYQNSGSSSLVELTIEGDENQKRNVIIHDVQFHPVSGEFQHIDFYQVKMDEEVTVEVELVFVGESPAVKELGGIFLKNFDSLEVKCLPKDLPKEIQVDISGLKNLEDCLYIKDIVFPQGVSTSIQPETVLATVVAPLSDQELKDLDKDVDASIDQVEGIAEKTEKTASKEDK